MSQLYCIQDAEDTGAQVCKVRMKNTIDCIERFVSLINVINGKECGMNVVFNLIGVGTYIKDIAD